MPARKYPLPKRFNVALSEAAYSQLRALNAKYRYGNNYLLTVILENFKEITDSEAVGDAFADFEREYGAPSASEMRSRR